MVFQSIIKHVKKDTRHNLAIFYIVCFLSAFPVTKLLGQYPDTLYMSHSMIGHATIVARKSVIHQPGFKVKPGLYYHALIDPNFSGTGTTIDPPPDSLPLT